MFLQRVKHTMVQKSMEIALNFLRQDNNKAIGDFWDAWWQQTYQVNSIVPGNVRMLRAT